MDKLKSLEGPQVLNVLDLRTFFEDVIEFATRT